MNPGSPLHEQDGYRELKSFQAARLVYDLTVRFCNRYIENNGRMHSRMVQAARSGVQNIVKGSQAGATSKTTELSLNSAARTSLEELRLDYENFLRQNNLPVWVKNDRRRKALSVRQCTTVDDVVLWVLQTHKRQSDGPPSLASSLPEITANAAITLIIVACNILEGQIGALPKRSGTK